MFNQIIGLIADIGLGALAYSLARSLKANVIVMQDVLKAHERRLDALEREGGKTVRNE